MSNKKGEIATILTIGSLVVLGLASLASSVFLKKTIKTQPRATSCSVVNDVSFSPSTIEAGQTFTCNLSGSIVNQYTMACGWSKNGGWPLGQRSGSCRGNSCTFQVKMDDPIDPNATYELVGFDFRNECGPNTGRRVSLNVAGSCPIPPRPFGLSGSCSASGNSATVSWEKVPGAEAYALRIDDTSNGWTSRCDQVNDGDACFDNLTTTSHTFPITPGHSYSWWVHSVNKCGWSDSDRTNALISCPSSASSPKLTQPECQGECCGKPDGYIVQLYDRMECDSNQGRYVIIEKVCQNNQIVDKPGCVSCRPCQAGDPPIAPVPGVDLAVNECTGGCGQNEGICSGLSDCDPNITPAVIRNCADSSFSCPSGYQPCKKEGAIWCYLDQDRGSSGGENPSDNSSGGRSLSDGSQSPNPPPEPKRGGLGEYCIDLKREDNMFQGKCNSDLVCDPKSGKCTQPPIPLRKPKEGELGGPCIISSEHGFVFYSCRSGLDCDTKTRTCVTNLNSNNPNSRFKSRPEDKPSYNSKPKDRPPYNSNLNPSDTTRSIATENQISTEFVSQVLSVNTDQGERGILLYVPELGLVYLLID